MSGLSAFQHEVALLFFSLPASDGFLLAGGGALLACGLTERPTEDLDFFGARGKADVGCASDQFEVAVARRGWSATRVHNSHSFVRLHVVGDSDVLVDIAIDVPPGGPAVLSIAGPTFSPEELAARKMAALFSRAEARDFADVYVLAQRFGRQLLVERAAEIDAGFEPTLLAEMMQTLDRFSDDEIPMAPSDVAGMRRYFRDWGDSLRSGT